MMGWGWDGWGWGMGLMMFFGLIFWGGIIVLIIWVVNRLTHHGTHMEGGQKGPLDIARERYARGEITKEQYEQLKKDLV